MFEKILYRHICYFGLALTNTALLIFSYSSWYIQHYYYIEYTVQVRTVCTENDGTVLLYLDVLWSYLGSSNSTETSLETHEVFLVFFILGSIFHPLNAAQLSSVQTSCQTLLFFSLFLEPIFLCLFCSYFFVNFKSLVVQPEVTKIDSQQVQL